MTPVKHAQSSAKKFGGDWKSYIDIHNWFDNTKAYTGDWTHRALRHHSAGIEWCVRTFGDTLSVRLDSGKRVPIPIKLIAEQHVMEDCGFIPTPQDWLRGLAKQPEDWMLRVATTKTTGFQIQEDT